MSYARPPNPSHSSSSGSGSASSARAASTTGRSTVDSVREEMNSTADPLDLFVKEQRIGTSHSRLNRDRLPFGGGGYRGFIEWAHGPPARGPPSSPPRAYTASIDKLTNQCNRLTCRQGIIWGSV